MSAQEHTLGGFQYIKLAESEMPFSRCDATFIMLNNDTKNVPKFQELIVAIPKAV